MKAIRFCKPFFKHKKRIFSVMYSWGAAVIIAGVLFKLTHLPYAKEMLFVGMICEIIVFFFSAFDPIEKDESRIPQKESSDQAIGKVQLEVARLNQNIQQLNILMEELIRKEHQTVFVDKDAETNTERMIEALTEMNKSYLSILHIQDQVISKQQVFKDLKK